MTARKASAGGRQFPDTMPVQPAEACTDVGHTERQQPLSTLARLHRVVVPMPAADAADYDPLTPANRRLRARFWFGYALLLLLVACAAGLVAWLR